MPENEDVRFFPIFLGATLGVLLEIIAKTADEIIVGNLFTDEAFAAVNLIMPYTLFEVFIAYLVTVAAAALFICLTRVTAIFYQYTRRIARTIILFGMAVALLPSLFAMLFGRIAPEGIVAGIALGPVATFALMYGYVRLVKKEKLYDYALEGTSKNLALPHTLLRKTL